MNSGKQTPIGLNSDTKRDGTGSTNMNPSQSPQSAKNNNQDFRMSHNINKQ